MTGLRACGGGKRWATEAGALHSKLAIVTHPDAKFEKCPAGCNGWHEVKAATSAPKTVQVDDLTREFVLARDGYRCVCCGESIIDREYSLQHRDARGMGGSRDPHSGCACNLVTMLGSATTLCHGRVESNTDPEDEARGFALRSGQVARLTPVILFDGSGHGVTLYPTCDGEWSSARPEDVAA